MLTSLAGFLLLISILGALSRFVDRPMRLDPKERARLEQYSKEHPKEVHLKKWLEDQE